MMRVAFSFAGLCGDGCFAERSLMTMRFWLLMMLGTTLAFAQAKPPDTVSRCRDLLNAAIHDKNPDVRKGAAEALSLMGFKDNVLESLAPMIDDRDMTVRIAAVTSLGDLKDRRTLPLLQKALRDPVAEVDFAAAKVLFQLRDPEGTQFLLDVVNGESKASSNYFNKERRNAVHMLHTPTRLFIYIGTQAAGLAPVPGLGFGISSAEGILMDPDTSARGASLLLMANSRDPRLSDAVASALNEKDWSLRAAAVHLIAMHPFPAYREKLVPLLDDKRGAVRLRAAAAYIRLGHEAAPPPVKRAMTTQH
jgi:HEAT repeat protein